ncbi:hypothetical protein [Micromonospora sp. DT229]|uniref:hypothetical protein n=1 Tax=Micromonospora sp. DT229 TaxID=3393430 RepID=UPI003CE70D0B
MARSEARLSVSIWTDPDFLALAPDAQRMFMFLISQPDLAHDGVIALRERRWSKSAAGLTRTDVEKALLDLAAARFVVIDEDAEELLIRSFIRRDKVYRQPNVLRAAQDHLEVVTSPIVRAAIGVELRRIANSEDLKGEAVRIVAEMLDAIGNPSGNPSPDPSANPASGGQAESDEGSPNPPGEAPDRSRSPEDASTGETPAEPRESAVSAAQNPSGKGSAKGSENPSAATPGERGVVTAVSSGSPFPDSPGPVPPPSAARPGEDDAVDGEIVDTPRTLALVADEPGPENAGHITKQWIDHCTANQVKLTDTIIKRYAAGIAKALKQDFPPALIKAALGQMLTDRVASRPALLDNYLVRAQQGPELPPRRATRTEASIARNGTSSNAALIRDALTRPA